MSTLTPKQSILIVDDEPINIKTLSETLKSGYEIFFATNGQDAYETAMAEMPDLILLDIMMPEEDGYEVCRRLKAGERTSQIPIIFVSAKGEEDDETKGLEIGAVDYIKKPFNQTVVKARVKTHLSLKMAHEKLESQNDLLREKVRERTRDLENTQIEIVERLGLASEYRDEGTGYHIKRMSEFCRFLGERAGFSSGECDILALASTLHDVGKIGIPDGILLKPGRLTPDEWEIMKTHTKIGAKLLSGSRSKLLRLAESIALTHHEKWDGSGYPMGIKGEEIPLVGRITAIADVFDALISKRPYKKPWPVDQALDEIKNSASTHFDPILTRHFLEIEPKVKVIVQEYP